jgi:hypothetical protein
MFAELSINEKPLTGVLFNMEKKFQVPLKKFVTFNKRRLIPPAYITEHNFNRFCPQ